MRCSNPWLPIGLAQGLRAGAYNQPHRDPFDHVLAAQAEPERLVLITADSKLSTFPCRPQRSGSEDP